jgi:hypothetical protein
MNGLIVSASVNTTHHNSETGEDAPLHDASGAFMVGARRFKQIHGLADPVFFDNSLTYPKRRKQILDAIDAVSGDLDVFAYFGHGWKTSLPSGGFRMDDIPDLASALGKKAAEGIVVILYACWAGVGGGPAEGLFNGLSGKGAVVYGHTSRKHTFANPDTVVFGDAEIEDGKLVIGTGDPLWKNWSKDIIDQKNDLWARFPFMTHDELEAELIAPEYLAGRWKVNHNKKSSWDNIFFMDKTVVKTNHGDQPFAVLDSGTWDVDHHNLLVTWSDGSIDRWPLHLSLHNQNVWVDDKGKKVHCHATRIEAPNVNQQPQFHVAAAAQ